MHRYFESRLQRALAMYALVPLFVLTLLGTILLVASWRYSVVGVNDEIREQAAERLAAVSDDFSRNAAATALFLGKARDLSQWEDSDYWRRGETFDPTKDYDGDGVSTIAEALSGTNPFDPEDVLKITAFTRNTAGGTRSGVSGNTVTTLAFDAIGGHAYSVEEATDLTKKDWKPCSFTFPDSDVPVNAISVPAGAGFTTSTVYLLPSNSTNAFFRVKAE